jgi:hypothetical protein
MNRVALPVAYRRTIAVLPSDVTLETAESWIGAAVQHAEDVAAERRSDGTVVIEATLAPAQAWRLGRHAGTPALLAAALRQDHVGALDGLDPFQSIVMAELDLGPTLDELEATRLAAAFRREPGVFSAGFAVERGGTALLCLEIAEEATSEALICAVLASVGWSLGAPRVISHSDARTGHAA